MSTQNQATNPLDLFRPWRWHEDTKSFVKKGLILSSLLNDRQAPLHVRFLCNTIQYYISLTEAMGWCSDANPHKNHERTEKYLHNAAVIANLTRHAYGLWTRRSQF